MSPVLHAWLFSLMLAAAPPDRYSNGPETVEQRTARYHDIADDALRVAFDPRVPPAFSGAVGRALTAELVVAVAFHESGFARDVDLGPCNKTRDPVTGLVRCDGGASACLMQIKVGAGSTREGWSREELFADRTKCFRAGLAKIRQSMLACRALPLSDRLTQYAAGNCDKSIGKVRSRELTGIARSWLARAPVPAVATWALDATPAPVALLPSVASTPMGGWARADPLP